jgi:hypothetical protein
MKERITGLQAARLADEVTKRKPVQLQAATENQDPPSSPLLPARQKRGQQRKAPPRVRKPALQNDHCMAPTTDLEKHRKCLRESFGNTTSDEFVDVVMGKLMTGLRPGPHDTLAEATLNAALAVIDSLQPTSEYQALMAVEIVIVDSQAHEFLRLSRRSLTREYVDLYGNHAVKLLRVKADLLRTYDRHKRGNKQSMEIRHVHIYRGGQAVVGMVNTPPAGRE